MSQVLDVIPSPLYLVGLFKIQDLNRLFAAPPETEECKPHFHDPFHESAMEYTRIHPPFSCHHNESGLTRVERGATLIVNSTLVTSLKATLINCSYQAIYRLSENSYDFSAPQVFEDEVKIRLVTDGVRVRCYLKNATSQIQLYENVHYIMTEKPEIEKKLQQRMLRRQQRSTSDTEKYRTGKAIPSYMNVLIVGIDSVSRFNMIRTMNRTRRFLLTRLHAVDFAHYNKIGLNTFPNLLPVMTGKKPHVDTGKQYIDKQGFRFLWQDFEDEGYRTMFAEDTTFMNIFRFAQRGFAGQPTHYYSRIVEMAKERSSQLFTNKEACFKGTPSDELMLDNMAEFARLYRHKPYFGFQWLTRTTHDDMNGGSRVDGYYEKFLSQLLEENLLNNTLLAFVSDHGIRCAGYRSTPIGRFEDNRPFLYLAFPPWFAETYPSHMKQVQANAGRLATPLDFHKILLDILYLNNKDTVTTRNDSKQGISFFKQIPRNRTCADAGIPPPFCVCLSERALPTTLNIAQQAGAVLVASFNAAMKKAKAMNVCHNLMLVEVKECRLLGGGVSYLNTFCPVKRGNRIVDNLAQLLRVTVVAKPRPDVKDLFGFRRKPNSDMVFDGMLIKCDNSLKRAGDVSRISLYGNTSHCVNDPFLKTVCYCKDQL
ncbi:uncharacterized protein [Littorina saxatilis]